MTIIDRWVSLAPGIILVLIFTSSCRSPKTAEQKVTTDVDTISEKASTALPVHDPAHPPIDCPLRKQGIDPAHLKPFEQVEEYIAFLERNDRGAWQKPAAVIDALHLNGDETIMDIGAGSGYFSFRFAKALPQGRVIAADIEPEMVRHIHHKAATEQIENIEARLIKPEDPEVSAGVDVVFICDVLHHVSDRVTWLSRIVDAMEPGAQLVVVEFKEGHLPEGPPESLKIPRRQIISLVTNAGLTLKSESQSLLPYQIVFVFQKNLKNMNGSGSGVAGAK